MGMSISAKLMYGVPCKELSELEDLDELLDNGELDYASPHYDADRELWIVGVEMPKEVAGEAEMFAAIRAAKAEFERLTNGTPGRIIVAANVN